MSDVTTEWEQSAEVAEVFKALVAAQGVMKNASRDAVNPFFSKDGRRASYATLAEVWDTCREPLTKHNLCVIQMPFTRGAQVGLRTMLAHASGQWISCIALVTPKAQGAQEYGSVTTYLRRYALQAFVGVASEDDDGERAEGRDKPPVAGGAAKANTVKAANNAKMADKAQVQQIHILKEKIGGWTGKADHDKHPYRAALLAYKNAEGKSVTTSTDLTFDQAANLLKRMQGMIDRQAENAKKMNGSGNLQAAANDDGEAPDPGLLDQVREAASERWGKGTEIEGPMWLFQHFGVKSTSALTQLQASKALQLLLTEGIAP
jgi:hypothetical protein